MRLFLAVRPPAPVLDHLENALAGARAGWPGSGGPGPVRWSAPENRHLTVAFYGEVSEGVAEELAGDLEDELSGLVPFALDLRGAGIFSHRTLWVGVGGDLARMQALVAAARRAGEASGTAPERRVRSRPHLTVGRLVPGGSGRSVLRRGGRRRGAGGASEGGGSALVAAMALYRGPPWTVDHAVLTASRPGAGRGGGPLYTPLRTILLDAPHPR